jgi:CubicO group peptidase (beta-lactamase class C family)
VLRLVAEGRIGLDDPVGRYLPRRLLAEMLTPVGTANEIRFR